MVPTASLFGEHIESEPDIYLSIKGAPTCHSRAMQASLEPAEKITYLQAELNWGKKSVSTSAVTEAPTLLF